MTCARFDITLIVDLILVLVHIMDHTFILVAQLSRPDASLGQ